MANATEALNTVSTNVEELATKSDTLADKSTELHTAAVNTLGALDQAVDTTKVDAALDTLGSEMDADHDGDPSTSL